MTKITKIVCILFILLTVCFHIVYATEENTLSTDTTSPTSEISETEEIPETESEDQSTSNFHYSGVTSVNQLSNYSEANLGLNNILSIILIAIGVLIILFAIAILIRLKH